MLANTEILIMPILTSQQLFCHHICIASVQINALFFKGFRHALAINIPFTQNTRHKVLSDLTHWGRVTHIYVSKLTIVGSDNGLSPDRWQAITWANAQTLGTNFIEILSDTYTF